ncbi:hypothetical protein [Burkholderia ubonensis]|uniref:hypothetical protein n=1 Tax=Burkholderia ubonensis TaxID=101571 RepID=UPI0012FC3121|nr:hypothetical protein [Burkholderia ubonensis]
MKNFIVMTVIALVAIGEVSAQTRTIPMLSEENCRLRFREVGAMRGYCRNIQGRWFWVEDLPTPIPHEPAPKVKPKTEAKQRADFEYLKKRLATESECELVRNRCFRDDVPVPVHCLPLPGSKIKRRDDINTFSALLQKPCEQDSTTPHK